MIDFTIALEMAEPQERVRAFGTTHRVPPSPRDTSGHGIDEELRRR